MTKLFFFALPLVARAAVVPSKRRSEGRAVSLNASLGKTSAVARRGGGHDENSTQHEQPSDYGDISCMRWTGGSCSMFSCSSERGPTVCDHGYCMCVHGACANAEGTCIREHGKFLGQHSIKFVHPYEMQRPYIGISSGTAGGAWFDDSGQSASREGVTHYLQSSGTSQPAWKMALTAGGHVRFESVAEPGRVMKLYQNRRRRTKDHDHDSIGSRRRFFFQQVGTHAAKGRNAGAPEGLQPLHKEANKKNKSVQLHMIPDDDDVWPVLVAFQQAHPLDVTFRVRRTAKDGGGLEIWDPQTRHSLASGNPAWYVKDRVAARGIAECREPGMGFFSDGCEGRQLVEFEPALPMEATPIVGRDYIYEISTLNWWQMLLFIFCFCGLAGAAFLCMSGVGLVSVPW